MILLKPTHYRSTSHNKDIKIATANVEKATGILTTTRSQLFLQINYNGGAIRTQISKNVALPES